MSAPAARLGDTHLCPIHGPVVAGTIAMPAILTTVFINNRSAITAGSLCICDSAPNTPHIIPGGSATVFIDKRAVARVLDATGHPGGRITTGSPNVFIGDHAAFAAAKVFLGKQHFGNCGLVNCQQVIRQATGQSWKEVNFLRNAINAGFAGFSVIHEQLGGMTAYHQEELLNALGVPSTTYIISNYQAISTGDIIATDAELRRIAKARLLWALEGRKGVIASVDAGKLWQNTNHVGYGHGIVITEGVFNENAELTHVYINDTGRNKQGRRMTIDEILDAMPLIADDIPMYAMVITNNAIWHRPPPAPSPGPTSFPRCPIPSPSDATANRDLVMSGAPDVLTGD